GLLDPAEPVDGGPVEAHPFSERSFELLRSDGEGLQEAQHVGEPQADEPDPAFLHGTQDVFGFGRQRHDSRVAKLWRRSSYARVKSEGVAVAEEALLVPEGRGFCRSAPPA